jgi:hypothetical protein
VRVYSAISDLDFRSDEVLKTSHEFLLHRTNGCPFSAVNITIELPPPLEPV